MTKHRVLLTGATGYIAGQLLPALREHYDLRLIDIRREDGSGLRVEGIEIANLLDEDRSNLERCSPELDTVVHTGHHKPTRTNPQSLYEGERRNVDMMQRFYQLALDNGVKQVVAASMNQAARWYELPYFEGLRDRVGPEDYPRPDVLRLGEGGIRVFRFPLCLRPRLGRKLEVI